MSARLIDPGLIRKRQDCCNQGSLERNGDSVEVFDVNELAYRITRAKSLRQLREATTGRTRIRDIHQCSITL